MINNRNTGLENNLIAQLEKLIRHNRQGSFKTRKRYAEAMQRFCIFLANKYRLQKLANIKEKHIEAYVSYMKEKGLAPSTIKTNLSGIRFWYDQIPSTKGNIPDNSKLNLQRRSLRAKERAWTHGEFNKMLALCIKQNRSDYITIFCLTRYTGLRIHECFRIDTAIAERALKSGIITIKGKGGLVRSVPINESIEIALKETLSKTPRGYKLFVPVHMETHKAIQMLQKFIRDSRDEISCNVSNCPLTFHGLRHLYACEKHLELKKANNDDDAAKLQVSKLLGHKRRDVTGIYLNSLNRVKGEIHE